MLSLSEFTICGNECINCYINWNLMQVYPKSGFLQCSGCNQGGKAKSGFYSS